MEQEELIKYCRLILRKIGHSLPPAPWIETSSFPGKQLTNFCRHCKKPFAIVGNEREFRIVQIRKDQSFDTNKAWSERREPSVLKEPIIFLNERDFLSKQSILNYLILSINPNNLPNVTSPPNDKELDPDLVIKDKIKAIEYRYYCPKINSWL